VSISQTVIVEATLLISTLYYVTVIRRQLLGLADSVYSGIHSVMQQSL